MAKIREKKRRNSSARPSYTSTRQPSSEVSSTGPSNQQLFRGQSFRERRPQPSDKCFRLGKDDYNLVNLVTRLNDFDPVELVENFIDASVLFNDVISPEYQEGVPIVKVKGSLKRNIAFWDHIGASCFIHDTIVDGCKIPFIYTPPAANFGNNRSAIQHSEFVEKAISDLLITGSVVECGFAPTVVNPLSVSIQANGKKRLILAELSRARSARSGAPWVTKFGKLSIRENLVMR